MAEALEGRNALIQVQVDNRYYTRKVGDLNRLTENLRHVKVKSKESYIGWMRERIKKAEITTDIRYYQDSCCASCSTFLFLHSPINIPDCVNQSEYAIRISDKVITYYSVCHGVPYTSVLISGDTVLRYVYLCDFTYITHHRWGYSITNI